MNKINVKKTKDKLLDVIAGSLMAAKLIGERSNYIFNKSTDFIMFNLSRAKAFTCDKIDKTVVFLHVTKEKIKVFISDTAYKTKGHLFNTYDKIRFFKATRMESKNSEPIRYSDDNRPKTGDRIKVFAASKMTNLKSKMPNSFPEAVMSFRGFLRVLKYEGRKVFAMTKDGGVKCYRNSRDYVMSIRKTTVMGVSAVAVCGFALVFMITTVAGSYAMSVSVNGQKVGFVENEDELAVIVNDLEKKLSQKNQNVTIEIKDDLIALSAAPKPKNEKTGIDEDLLMNTIMSTDAITATAAAITVDGNQIVCLGTKDDAEDVLTAITDRYNVEGEDVITGFRQDVAITDAAINVASLMPTETAITYLLTGNETIKQHKVKGDETDWDIAKKYGLTEKDIKNSNPGMDTKVIKKGDILNINKLAPFVNVEVLATVNDTEKLDYNVEEVETDDLYIGETEVRSEGAKGEAIVTERAIYVNGKEESAQLIDKKVIKKPENRIVLVGTKEKPVEEETSYDDSSTTDYSNSNSGSSNNKSDSNSNSGSRSKNKTKNKDNSGGGGSYVSSTVGLSDPMKHMELSSPFGYRGGRMHTGADFRNPSGTPIYASAAGKVTSSGYDGAYGNTVRINHGSGMTTVYAHMNSIHVKNGAKVSRGQQIGTVGKTGRATGYHLHFEVRINGNAKNPLNYL